MSDIKFPKLEHLDELSANPSGVDTIHPEDLRRILAAARIGIGVAAKLDHPMGPRCPDECETCWLRTKLGL